MAKDPAFLFYPAEASEDTQHMNRLERGCYFDILKAQKRFGRFTLSQIKKILGNDFDSCWETVKMSLSYEEDMFFICWVDESLTKRREYSKSRSDNRKKDKNEDSKLKKENISESYVDHMGNRNVYSLESNINTSIGLNKNKPTPVVQQMIGVYLESFPKYFRDDEKDFSACFSITQKVENLKGWSRGACMNGKMEEFLVFWREVVDYVKGDEWLSGRSLTDLSTREWQRLGQHMSKEPKERKKTKKEESMTDYQKELHEKREAARNRKPE